MTWTPNSVKSVFHIFDAPGHGKDICDSGDDYPGGSPDGFKIQDQMREFARLKINFTCVKVNESCNKMIDVMRDSYGQGGMVLNITDLAKACSTKSQAEVTKEFVAKSSYILSVAVGGGASTKTGSGPKSAAKVVRKGGPLWEPKDLAVG